MANGGVIGKPNNPTNMKASGSWKLEEAVSYNSSSTWPGLFNIDYIIVAGGGGGCGNDSFSGAGGGGGAGGVVIGSTVLSLGQSYTIEVGAGGTASSNVPSNGSNSIAFGKTAFGGGAGGARGAYSAFFGGSGGGGGGGQIGTPAFSEGGGSISGQGSVGGRGQGNASSRGGGGGGGYSQKGLNASEGATGGNGLNLLTVGFSETESWIAGGGGGGGNEVPGGFGGKGGGGGGINRTSGATAENGTQSTGGGGGGNAISNPAPATNGGSGVVIIRYLGPSRATGGTISSITISGQQFTVHTFTTVGTLSFTFN